MKNGKCEEGLKKDCPGVYVTFLDISITGKFTFIFYECSLCNSSSVKGAFFSACRIQTIEPERISADYREGYARPA